MTQNNKELPGSTEPVTQNEIGEAIRRLMITEITLNERFTDIRGLIGDCLQVIDETINLLRRVRPSFPDSEDLSASAGEPPQVR
ncbi:MAG: hypothetical protein WCT01_04840 [Candidatus Shapirobacteria bacterium]